MKAHLRKLLFTLFGSFACISIGASLPVTAATSLPAVEEALTASPTLPDQPELEANLEQTEPEQQIAYGSVYCQTYTDGYSTVTCCVDALGNWACVTH